MANASVGGLVSGLDTATIINQLMQVEAQPQTMLKSRLTTQQSAVSSLQALNAKLAALATKAHDLAKAAQWSPVAATSSSDKATATAAATATPGSLSFSVVQTARTHQLTFNSTANGTDVVVSGGTTVLLNGTSYDTGDGTLNGLVTALNKPGTGVTASTVRLDDGTLRLRVESNASGAGSAFTLTNADGSALLGDATVVTGQDAAITVGPDTIHSATNTFTGLMAGVDVTLASDAPALTAVTITVARDAKAASDAAKGLVDAANGILADIDKLTSFDAATKKSGPLAADSTLRSLRSSVLDAVTGAADGSSLAGIGIQLDRYGKITFDQAKFDSAYAADPAKVGSLLGTDAGTAVPGFAARLETVATQASDAYDGTLTADITGRQSSVTDMQSAIDSWDDRLALRRNALNRQFSALEVSLGKLQDQSSWLAGQISSLPTGQ